MNCKKYYTQSWQLPKIDCAQVLLKSDKYSGQRFFWQTPDDKEVLLGLGYLLTFEGLDYLKLECVKERLKKEWCAINAQATPLLFGGFCFDKLAKKEEFWQEMLHGMFVWPKILFKQTDAKCELCLTVQAKELDEAKEKLAKLYDEVKDLIATLISVKLKKAYQGQLKASMRDKEEWLLAAKETIGLLNSQEKLCKVVLARCQDVYAQKFYSEQLLINLLSQQPNTYRFMLESQTRFFIGATPERLLKADGENFQTASVAGTFVKATDPKENERLIAALLADPKNTVEHQIVVERICHDLAQVASDIQVSDREVLQNQNLQHLFLTIKGKRKPAASFLEALKHLHPTPALGGEPKQLALEWIRKVEPMGRGMYGAPVGWLDLQNDSGEFSVAIRSGVFTRKQQENYGLLYAGCGIIAASVAESELAETAAKFTPMKRGIEGK